MTHRRLWLVAPCPLLVLPVDMPGVALQLLLLLLLNIHHTSCHLLLGSQLNTVVLQVVLLEGGGVHQDNGILDQSLCSDLQESGTVIGLVISLTNTTAAFLSRTSDECLLQPLSKSHLFCGLPESQGSPFVDMF